MRSPSRMLSVVPMGSSPYQGSIPPAEMAFEGADITDFVDIAYVLHIVARRELRELRERRPVCIERIACLERPVCFERPVCVRACLYWGRNRFGGHR